MTRLDLGLATLRALGEAAIDLDEEIAQRNPAADPVRHVGIVIPRDSLAALIGELELVALEHAAHRRAAGRFRGLGLVSIAISVIAVALSLAGALGWLG